MSDPEDAPDIHACDECDPSFDCWSRALLCRKRRVPRDLEPESEAPTRYSTQGRCMTRCQSDCDGDCTWDKCPQLRDGEPAKSGRHCPLDNPPPETAGVDPTCDDAWLKWVASERPRGPSAEAFFAGWDAAVADLPRYQRATLRILALFDGDPLRPDDPAHFLVERLEALLDQNYLATRAEVDEAKARHSDFVDNFAKSKLAELERQTERATAAEAGLRRAHQALADRAVASGAAWRTAPDRASCPVCGEPLGQVPPGLRPQLGDWSCDTCPEERGTAGACQADLMHRGMAFFWDRDVRRDSGPADARPVTVVGGTGRDVALVTRHAYDELEARVALLRRERNAAAESASNGFWYWSDTDPNDLQSLTDDALVTMRAGQLRELLCLGVRDDRRE